MLQTAVLTPRQHEVYQYILAYWLEHMICPCIREIAQHSGKPVWPSAVNKTLEALEAKGLIDIYQGIERGIVIVGVRESIHRSVQRFTQQRNQAIDVTEQQLQKRTSRKALGC